MYREYQASEMAPSQWNIVLSSPTVGLPAPPNDDDERFLLDDETFILGNEVPTEGAGNLPLWYLVHHVARKFRGKKNLSNALIKVF